MQSALPLLSCLLAVNAYSGGPPSSTCDNMRPGPPHQPNTIRAGAKSPYSLVAEARNSSQVDVTLGARARRGAVFRGFMIMAEVDGDKGHGRFYPTRESKNLCGTLDCEGLFQGKDNAITHNSNEDKNSITVIWTAPSSMMGQLPPAQVVFQATVVGENSDDKSTWWEDIRSNIVTLRP